jgi:hypothetical protein
MAVASRLGFLGAILDVTVIGTSRERAKGASPFRCLGAIEQSVIHAEVAIRSEECFVRPPIKDGGCDETQDFYAASDGMGLAIKLEERRMEGQQPRRSQHTKYRNCVEVLHSRQPQCHGSSDLPKAYFSRNWRSVWHQCKHFGGAGVDVEARSGAVESAGEVWSSKLFALSDSIRRNDYEVLDPRGGRCGVC